MDNYCVVIKQRKTWFGWRRTQGSGPLYCRNYDDARKECNHLNAGLQETRGKIRYVIIHIYEV